MQIYNYSANEIVLFHFKITISIGCASFNVDIELHLTLAYCQRLLESCAQAAIQAPLRYFFFNLGLIPMVGRPTFQAASVLHAYHAEYVFLDILVAPFLADFHYLRLTLLGLNEAQALACLIGFRNLVVQSVLGSFCRARQLLRVSVVCWPQTVFRCSDGIAPLFHCSILLRGYNVCSANMPQQGCPEWIGLQGRTSP